MPRTGRPKLTPSQRKNAPLTVRLTREERAKVDAKASKAGKDASKWARDVLLGS